MTAPHHLAHWYPTAAYLYVLCLDALAQSLFVAAKLQYLLGEKTIEDEILQEVVRRWWPLEASVPSATMEAWPNRPVGRYLLASAGRFWRALVALLQYMDSALTFVPG